MKKPIHTLEELQREKQKLLLEMEATEHLLSKSVQELPEALKQTLLQNLVLPFGIAGLLGFGAKKMMESKSNGQAHNNGKNASLMSFLPTVLPVLISLGKAYYEEKVSSENLN